MDSYSKNKDMDVIISYYINGQLKMIFMKISVLSVKKALQNFVKLEELKSILAMI